MFIFYILLTRRTMDAMQSMKMSNIVRFKHQMHLKLNKSMSLNLQIRNRIQYRIEIEYNNLNPNCNHLGLINHVPVTERRCIIILPFVLSCHDKNLKHYKKVFSFRLLSATVHKLHNCLNPTCIHLTPVFITNVILKVC